VPPLLNTMHSHIHATTYNVFQKTLQIVVDSWGKWCTFLIPTDNPSYANCVHNNDDGRRILAISQRTTTTHLESAYTNTHSMFMCVNLHPFRCFFIFCKTNHSQLSMTKSEHMQSRGTTTARLQAGNANSPLPSRPSRSSRSSRSACPAASRSPPSVAMSSCRARN
jgi:hypothetical protein